MTKQLLPQLAVDVIFEKMRFPSWGFQKVDGVRGCHITGMMTGRSLKPHGNKAITAFYSQPDYTGFDGEFTLDGRLTGGELCNKTNSLMTTHDGNSNVVWNLFDYLHPFVVGLTYQERYEALAASLDACMPYGVNLLPWVLINSVEEAQAWIDKCLADGYEGAIFRDPKAMHKSGRATAKANDFWRFKPVSDKDAIVLSVEEGQTNNNEAKLDPRGHTERSTNAENMVPNGMAGCLICRDCATGDTIRVSPGAMKHDERIDVFLHPEKIVGGGIKYRSLDTGVKSAPRQARYVCRRSLEDML